MTRSAAYQSNSTNVVQLFSAPPVAVSEEQGSSVAVEGALFDSSFEVFQTQSGLTMVPRSGVKVHVAGGDNMFYSPYSAPNSDSSSPTVPVKKVALVSSVCVGSVSAFSLISYFMYGAILVHPIISVVLLLSSVFFAIMSRMVK